MKLPEGFAFTEAQKPQAQAFIDIFNDAKVTSAQRAEKLLAMYAETVRQGSEKATEAWIDQQKAWQEECRNDKDLGGAKLDPALGKISELLDKFGSPELNAVFAETGAGNSIHMVRFLHKIAMQMTEAGPVPAGVPSPPQVPLEDRLYPKTVQAKG